MKYLKLFEDFDLYKNKKLIIKNGIKFYLCQLTGVESNVFIVETELGLEVGRATLNKDNYLDNIRIDDDFRRIGLASELYKFIQEQENIKLKPSPIKQSDVIKKFWQKFAYQ